MTNPLVAWVDESGSNSSLDPNTFIMAALIATAGQLDVIRRCMLDLRLPGQTKMHWRDERPSRRRQIIELIADLDVEHLVIVTSPHAESCAGERRRRLTLEILLPELAELGVSRAVFESRGKKDDQRDRAMLDHLRQQHALDASLRMDHAIGREEPALWVPDALCGVISAMRCGDGSNYERIESKVTLRQLPPRA